MSFKDFLLLKLQEYERSQNRRVSIEQFAIYLGVSRVLVSYWINGRNLPSTENVELLAKRLGPEVYDALDIPRPDPDLQALTQLWQYLSDDTRHTLREMGEQYAADNKKKRA